MPLKFQAPDPMEPIAAICVNDKLMKMGYSDVNTNLGVQHWFGSARLKLLQFNSVLACKQACTLTQSSSKQRVDCRLQITGDSQSMQ